MNPVVSMSTEKTKPVVEEATVVTRPKLITNWKAFEQANLGVRVVQCDGYVPIHPHNQGCHTKLIPTAKAMSSHIDGEHAGGFVLELTQDSAPNPLWNELREDGIEVRDLRCGHCGAEVRLHPVKLKEHGWKAHPGMFSKTKPDGKFYITLTRETPLVLDDEVN
jgi:hypothetical protein